VELQCRVLQLGAVNGLCVNGKQYVAVLIGGNGQTRDRLNKTSL